VVFGPSSLGEGDWETGDLLSPSNDLSPGVVEHFFFRDFWGFSLFLLRFFSLVSLSSEEKWRESDSTDSSEMVTGTANVAA
jgi:hypothetical protein